MKLGPLLSLLLLEPINLIYNLTFTPDIKVSVSLIEDGYFFNCEIITQETNVKNINVTFDGITIFETKRTENKYFTFTLERSKGLLEYEGYKNLKIESQINDCLFLSDVYSVLGLNSYDKKEVNGEISIDYVLDNDHNSILKESFELKEDTTSIFPIDINFKMKNFMSLYVEREVLDKLSFAMIFEDQEIVLQPLYIKNLDKYTLVSKEVKFDVEPGIYISELLVSYEGFVNLDFVYKYDAYFKKIIGNDHYSQYRLIFGEEEDV